MSLILKNRNIFLLFLSGALRNFMVIMPVLALFFQSHGLSLAEIMILQVVFSVIIVGFEIPSWYIADVFKRKYSLNIGLFMVFLWLLYPKEIGFPHFLFFWERNILCP